jgi:hypothetical protein
LQKILYGKTSSIFPPKPLGLPYLLNKQKSPQGLNLSGFQDAGALLSNASRRVNGSGETRKMALH